MPCRTEMIHCNLCGGEHYMAQACVEDPTLRGEGLVGYNRKTAAFDTAGALCDLLSSLEHEDLLDAAEIPQDVLNWWEAHQAGETEKLKAEGLAKLSAKEKRALGLK